MRNLADIVARPQLEGPSSQESALPGRLEHLFLFGALLLLMGTFRVPLLTGTAAQLVGISQISAVVLFGTYAIALGLMLMHCRSQILEIVFRNKLLIVVAGYALLSTLWSVDPSLSMRRGAAYCLTLVFCFYAVLRFPLVRILELVLLGIVVSCAVSVLELLLQGGLFSGPRWAGVFGYPTFFGRIVSVGVILTLALWRTPWLLQRYDALVLLLFVICLAGTFAVTAIAALAAAIFTFLVLFFQTLSASNLMARFLVLALLAGLFGLALVTSYVEILELFGKDETLSFRTYIWQSAIDKGPESLWFGSGFRAFWIWPHASDVMFNTHGSLNSRVGNGHSGYLDIWLELGWVGIGMVLAVYVQAGWRAWRWAVSGRDRELAFLPVLLVFIIVYSVAEVVLMEHSELTWMLLMLGSIAADRSVSQSREPGLLGQPRPVGFRG